MHLRASSDKKLPRGESTAVLAESCILDLTKYELGNGIWKEYSLHQAMREEEFHEFIGLLRNVVDKAGVLTPNGRDLSDVAEIAAKEKITFFDASYITLAKIRKLTLVTEDGQLAKTASTYTKTSMSKHLTPS
jgi:predicted nucleic acid-binding protein